MEGMKIERKPWIHMAKLLGDFYSEPDSSESLYPSVNKELSYVIFFKKRKLQFYFLLRVEIGTMHRNNTEIDYRLV